MPRTWKEHGVVDRLCAVSLMRSYEPRRPVLGDVQAGSQLQSTARATTVTRSSTLVLGPVRGPPHSSGDSTVPELGAGASGAGDEDEVDWEVLISADDLVVEDYASLLPLENAVDADVFTCPWCGMDFPRTRKWVHLLRLNTPSNLCKHVFHDSQVV